MGSDRSVLSLHERGKHRARLFSAAFSFRVSAALLPALGALTATLLAAPAALAEPSPADRETARNLMKQGDTAFAAKDFTGALKAYGAANAIMQVPSTGLPLAKAQVEKGLLIEARDTLLQVARHPHDANEPAAFAKARDEASALAQKIAPLIPSLLITIEGAPSDAAVEITVDGTIVSAAALTAPRKMNPGAHVITASAPGFRTETANVTLKEGQNEKLALKLTPGESTPVVPTSAAATGPGRIKIVSPTEPGNVFVDGKAVGATPLDVPAAAGRHEVEIEYPGGTHDEKIVTVKAGAAVEVEFQPSPMDAVVRYRKGLNIGFSAGMSMAVPFDYGSPLYGASATFVVNIGITPTFDFRTGATAAFLHKFVEDDIDNQLSAVVPAMLRVNWSPWFSTSAGLSVGFATNLNDRHGLSIGPEWSILTMCAGEKREYELSFAQGLRFGDLRQEYHQSLVFTYLFLD